MEVLLLVYNLFLQVLYCIPVVYAWILFQHTRKYVCLYIIGLFFSFSVENIIIFITEFNPAFAKLYNNIFMSVPTSRTVIFVAVLLFMLLITISILKEQMNYFLLTLLVSIILYMLFVPIMKDSAVKIFVYYTPCQLFSFVIGFYGLRRLKAHPEYYNEILRKRFHQIFLWTAVVSLLIIVEDWIVIFHFDNYREQNIHIINRSFSENLLSIYFVYAALRILVPYLQTFLVSADDTALPFAESEFPAEQITDSQMKSSGDLPADKSPDEIPDLISDVPYTSLTAPDESIPETELPSDQADYSKFYLFSRDYQLTPREQHILQLLLENKTNVEIGEDLCISVGTAKAHVHNIFSKVEVKKRKQLLDVYEHYTPSDS